MSVHRGGISGKVFETGRVGDDKIAENSGNMTMDRQSLKGENRYGYRV